MYLFYLSFVNKFKMLLRPRISIGALRLVLGSTVRKSPRFGLHLPSRVVPIPWLRIAVRGYVNGPGSRPGNGSLGPFPRGMGLGDGE